MTDKQGDQLLAYQKDILVALQKIDVQLTTITAKLTSIDSKVGSCQHLSTMNTHLLAIKSSLSNTSPPT